jgi:hypothetical protein
VALASYVLKPLLEKFEIEVPHDQPPGATREEQQRRQQQQRHQEG